MKTLSIITFLFLAACTPQVSSPAPTPPPKTMPPPAPPKIADMVKSEEDQGQYVDAFGDMTIASSAIGNGNSSLLFFYASWCGYCQTKDANLKELYRDESLTLSTYKIDFDTASELKARYAVASQDTVVLIDGSGNSKQVIMGATKDELRTILSAS